MCIEIVNHLTPIIVATINHLTPIIAAVIGASWFYKEKKRKQVEMYEELIKQFSSFYESNSDELGRTKFLEQYRFSFMYSSDDVIKSINKFLSCVHSEASEDSKKNKEKAAEDIFIAIRKDTYNFFKILFKRTKLTCEDFKHVRVNK
jgi:hypothetical protein